MSDGLQARLEGLERRKRDLEAELAEAPPPAPRFHLNLTELYRRKVERLHEALSEPSTRQEAVEILRSLIDAVVLKPVEFQTDALPIVHASDERYVIRTGSSHVVGDYRFKR